MIAATRTEPRTAAATRAAAAKRRRNHLHAQLQAAHRLLDQHGYKVESPNLDAALIIRLDK